MTTPGRNTQCPCGSLKKYKYCCGNAANSPQPASPLQLVEVGSTETGGQSIAQQVNSLFQQGKGSDAIEALRNFLHKNPRNVEALEVLSDIFMQNKRWDEAIEILKQAVSILPSNEKFLNYLSVALFYSGRANESFVFAREIIKRYPNSTNAKLFLPVLRVFDSGNNEQLLDEIKERFETTATGYDDGRMRIGYSTPQLLLREVAESMSGRPGRVLDLGCGTGLGGEAFRASASYLAGVDSSESMLQLARNKGIYDQLDLNGIFEYLHNTSPSSWDVIYASSVFLYFGSLVKLFKYCQSALTVGGVLTFDLLVESHFTGGYSVASVNGLIFEHDPSFVEKEAALAGLTFVQKKAQTFQYITVGIESPGYIFTFKKSAI